MCLSLKKVSNNLSKKERKQGVAIEIENTMQVHANCFKQNKLDNFGNHKEKEWEKRVDSLRISWWEIRQNKLKAKNSKEINRERK